MLYVGRRVTSSLLVQGLAGNPQQECTHDTIRDVGDRSSLSHRILAGPAASINYDYYRYEYY